MRKAHISTRGSTPRLYCGTTMKQIDEANSDGDMREFWISEGQEIIYSDNRRVTVCIECKEQYTVSQGIQGTRVVEPHPQG